MGRLLTRQEWVESGHSELRVFGLAAEGVDLAPAGYPLAIRKQPIEIPREPSPIELADLPNMRLCLAHIHKGNEIVSIAARGGSGDLNRDG
jgi:hypothetical protein